MCAAKPSGNYLDSGYMSEVVATIARLCSPRQIYLYNQRINSKKEITSFKLCVVADTPDKFACERDIYAEADCEIPFDILIYTSEEWISLQSREGSFAGRIKENGVVVYNG